jgi:hypothetical protein
LDGGQLLFFSFVGKSNPIRMDRVFSFKKFAGQICVINYAICVVGPLDKKESVGRIWWKWKSVSIVSYAKNKI